MNSHLKARRDRVAKCWALTNEVVLVGSGEPIPIPGGADQVYPFLPHQEYRYLSGRDTPGAVVAFDPQEGWSDFVPPVTEAERVWEGRQPFAWDGLQSIAELGTWIEAHRGRTMVNLGCAIKGVKSDLAAEARVREALMQARRPKDAEEMALIHKAVAATAAGFDAAKEFIRPGVTERAIQVTMEAEFFRRGGDRTAYGSIVGAGSNAAVLHFSPSERVVKSGDVVLIDAGAEVDGYAADITRTFFADGKPSGFGGDLYAMVLAAQIDAVNACRVGMEFRELHLSCARAMTEGLVSLGIMKGDPDQLVERDAHAMFFPHGLGHLVGLGVRDASGYLPGRERSSRFGLNALRIDMPLQRDYVVTVEPGIYFIPAILTDGERRQQFSDAVNWSRVDELLQFGGIRIEDNVRVTDGAPDVLTAAVPK